MYEIMKQKLDEVIRENIFVDGYNVINSWPNLKKLKISVMNPARQQLIDTTSKLLGI